MDFHVCQITTTWRRQQPMGKKNKEENQKYTFTWLLISNHMQAHSHNEWCTSIRWGAFDREGGTLHLPDLEATAKCVAPPELCILIFAEQRIWLKEQIDCLWLGLYSLNNTGFWITLTQNLLICLNKWFILLRWLGRIDLRIQWWPRRDPVRDTTRRPNKDEVSDGRWHCEGSSQEIR